MYRKSTMNLYVLWMFCGCIFGCEIDVLRIKYGYTMDTVWMHYGCSMGALRMHMDVLCMCYVFTMDILWMFYL